MRDRLPFVTWCLVLLVVAFHCAALLRDDPKAPRWPQVSLLSGRSVLRSELDHAALKSSVARLAPVQFGRQFGNSLRFAAGQRLAWITWGGRNPGMLFPSVDLWVSRAPTAEQIAEFQRIAGVIADYRKRLATEGWSLIVLPVPTKLGIHRELCNWPVLESDLISRDPLLADASDSMYGAFAQALKDSGVEYVDLQTRYRSLVGVEPMRLLYATNDSHWSGAGIFAASQAVAATVARITPLHARDPQSPTFLAVEHEGDLSKAFDLHPSFVSWLSPIRVFDDRLMDGEKGFGYRYPDKAQGLVVVAGTSYTGQYTWLINQPVGFAWQLGLHLDSVETQNRAHAGQGSFFTFRKFWEERRMIASDFETRRGQGLPKVIVWEFPFRDVRAIGSAPALP